uniref:WD repeat-containing protein 19 n=1 Tax=Heliothis virescens TaxID=7102 RepID=A0A2A4K789_HELVI
MGELYFLWQKGESHSLLATTGTDATVAVHDRSGQLMERMKLQGLCAGMEWDQDGDYLAIITPNSNTVLLWECHANKRINIETGLREPPSCIAWAYGEPLLAVGTQKGNLALYNHHTTKRIPIIGKHTKKITCAAWNKDSILVLASEDKSLSINNSDGDTLRMISLRDIPNDLQFSEMKTDERVAGENTISLVVGKRTLYLYNLLNPENPIELAFQQRYGSIVSYKWYGDGYILIGFSAGYIIAISTHIKEVGEELFQVKNHKDNLTDVAVCNGMAASCGDGQLKLIAIWNNGEVSGSVMPAGGAERCAWSSDGRLLATAGRAYLNVYVTALPPLHAAYGTRVITLTSLTEATVYQCIAVGDEPEPVNKSEPAALATYTLPTEPSVIALGGSHVCCASGTLAWFYPLAGGAATRRQYPAAIDVITLAGDYAAALFQGRAMLHAIDQVDPSQPEKEAILFPEPHMQGAKIVDIHLTSDFFIFVTDQGHVEYFGVEEWRSCGRWKHACGARGVYCDIGGARACVLDERRRVHVYCPAPDHVCALQRSQAADVRYSSIHSSEAAYSTATSAARAPACWTSGAACTCTVPRLTTCVRCSARRRLMLGTVVYTLARPRTVLRHRRRARLRAGRAAPRARYCDIGGARACVLDERRRVHVYCPAPDHVCALQRSQAADVRYSSIHSSEAAYSTATSAARAPACWTSGAACTCTVPRLTTCVRCSARRRLMLGRVQYCDIGGARACVLDERRRVHVYCPAPDHVCALQRSQAADVRYSSIHSSEAAYSTATSAARAPACWTSGAACTCTVPRLTTCVRCSARRRLMLGRVQYCDIGGARACVLDERRRVHVYCPAPDHVCALQRSQAADVRYSSIHSSEAAYSTATSAARAPACWTSGAACTCTVPRLTTCVRCSARRRLMLGRVQYCDIGGARACVLDERRRVHVYCPAPDHVCALQRSQAADVRYSSIHSSEAAYSTATSAARAPACWTSGAACTCTVPRLTTCVRCSARRRLMLGRVQYCDIGGARACVLDERRRVHVYCPAPDHVCALQRSQAADVRYSSIHSSEAAYSTATSAARAPACWTSGAACTCTVPRLTTCVRCSARRRLMLGRVQYCDIGGARACVLDERRRVHVYCPAPDHVCALQRSQAADVRGIIWDICLSDRNVFIIYTDEAIETYYYAANSINGSHIDLVGITPLLAGQIPLILFSGDVYCYGSGGTVLKLALDSHNTSGLADADTEKRLANQRRHIDKLLALRRFSEAWLFCDAVDEPELWRKMGEAAIAELNVEFAIRVYTRLSDVAMVWALEDASHIEDLSILCGTLCACLCQGSAAARWLESSPAGALHALELHAARGDWARAADIAAVSCPAKAPAITLHRAQHLELTADYHEALANYEKSLITENTDDIKVKEHNDKCEAGIARMSIRCGDVMRGLTTAMKHSHDIMLVKECAQLLEEEKQYSHAAALYDQAGNTEKAASLYIKLKSWLKVEALLPKINSPSIHIQYAKAKEAEGRYHDALKSYLKAQDYEAAIRLNLDKLDDIDEAVNLVQETKSIQGAKMVANYFQNSDDPTSAIKFLVMSLCYDEAFQLARKNGKLQLYGEILIQTSQARPEDFKSLALHFEGEKNHLLAGKFYFHAGEYSKAMSHLLRSGGSEEEDNEAISIAIDAAAASDDERLTRRLIEFLLGETDGTPREPRHLFRLYMAKRQFAEAAKTAIIIAGAECRAGKYREARDVVRAMCVSLRASRMPVPRDMRHAIALLHSYILVRTHVKRGRHDLAARLLLRTAADVTFFPTPQHQVSILTSTVIECSRAGLKHQAYHWARVLMQPEYRSQIDPKYVKKIESVVRHGARDPPAPAVTSPCPHCSAALPQAELTCARCEADVPFCLASVSTT